MNRLAFILLILVSLFQPALAQDKAIIKGIVYEGQLNTPLEAVTVKASNLVGGMSTNKKGEFYFSFSKRNFYRITFSRLGYQSQVREVKSADKDTIFLNVYLQREYKLLDSISILAVHKPETLIGKPDYSIYDFDFYEDKLLLLTASRSLSSAKIQLANYEGKIFSSFSLPKQAGEAKHFFHDFEGYTDLICKDSIFRLDVINTDLIVAPINQNDFNKYLKPVSDTADGKFYVSNHWEKYPSFNYYSLMPNDTVGHLLQTISNQDLMKLYNLEYYYLAPARQLEARRMADYYKVDKHIIAALMSGFTQSMFYEPLYAPLFILQDTICIFNHHNDFLYHYNKNNDLIDSVKISYHHPKNWRDWKKKLFVDEPRNKVYAFFSKNGHHYLKQIDHQSGKEVLTYKLKHHSAERIKIKDGYVYYVYRPFDSTQERFLYRERIE